MENVGRLYVYLDDLKKEIQNGFYLINTTKGTTIIHLYKTFRRRLIKILENNGKQRES